MILLFDLDGTMICSKHRQNTLPDGTLNLEAWIENNTHEKIMLDTLLPLSELWKYAQQKNHTIIVCTARVCSNSDFTFLENNGLFFNYFLSRPAGNNMPDSTLKIALLKKWASENGMTWRNFCAVTRAYDDSESVLKAYKEHNIESVNAKEFN